jgi:hypothetical protein
MDAIQHESTSNNTHFDEHFLNMPTSSNMPADALVPGLIKNPHVPSASLFTSRHGDSILSKQLLEKLTGSFERYDGDRVARGYSDENSELLANVVNSLPIGNKMATSLDENNFNISSSSRIDAAVQKRREHLKQKEKSMFQMYSKTLQIGSSDSSSSSAYQAFPSPPFTKTTAIAEYVKRRVI